MPWPSLSIIVTSLNRASFIQRTLLSILRQDYPGNVEVIVADGGSTDGTVEVLRRYPQVNWWSAPDGGIVDAINKGLAQASGEFVAIQDSDNFYLRDALRLTLSAARDDRGLDIVTGCDVYLEPDGRTFACSPLDDHAIDARSLLMRRVIPIHCAFIRRAIIEPVGGFRKLSDLRKDVGGDVGNVGVDIDFWYRALHLHRGRFVPHHTAVYQRHAAMMSLNSPRWLANMTEMVERCEADERFGGRFKLSADDKLNLFARWEIQQARIEGDDARVRELVQRVMNGPPFTDESRAYLMLHGFVEKPSSRGPRKRHPNHKVPELHWYMEPMRRGAAA
jgi:glycosyltransferase involved in cell wall biosynthesis